MDFATALKTIRKERGYTQSSLAKELNVSQNAVYNWENRKCEPSIEMIKKIADVFNVSMDYIMGKISIGNYQVPTEWVADANYKPIIDAIGNGLGDPNWDKMHDAQSVVYNNLLLSSFSKLNNHGKEKAIERVQELTEIEKYRKKEDNYGTPCTPDEPVTI